VFSLEGEQIVAYDLSKGSRLWLTTITTTIEPAIGTNEVFIADEGGISALSLSSGELVWRQPFAETLATPPVVDRDRLILTTSGGDIVALRASDGMELWRQRLAQAPSSRPAVTSTRVFVATGDKQVVALNSDDGAVLWSRMLGGVGRDILAGDDRIFLGSSDRVFYCLNTKDGEVAWRWPTADAIGLPSADDRVVYFVSLDNLLRGLNRSNGVQQWKSALPFRPISGPLRWSETLVVAGTEPVLQGFSTREGKSLGRFPVSTELSAQPYLFVDNSKVFPVLVTISADIVGRATVTGATREIEPTQLALTPLPNVVSFPTMPAAPRVLEVVSPLPNLIRVDPAARP